MRTFEINWVVNKGTECTIKFVSLADAQKFAEAKGAKKKRCCYYPQCKVNNKKKTDCFISLFSFQN